MMHKGVEYQILRAPTQRVWAWSACPTKSEPIQGKSHSLTMATTAAKRAINKWLALRRAEEKAK
jgi:hypothetical protein